MVEDGHRAHDAGICDACRIIASPQSQGISCAAVRRQWASPARRQAADRRIGVLGLRMLGQAVIERLTPFGFRCPGGAVPHARSTECGVIMAPSRYRSFLGETDILVCLLPLTGETRGHSRCAPLCGPFRPAHRSFMSVVAHS
ncbi:hypothetical protein F2981_27875 (plasmid) [Sinorhizobium meliloti]|nr:hypothetical protein [Sinorhizobium meliloti]